VPLGTIQPEDKRTPKEKVESFLPIMVTSLILQNAPYAKRHLLFDPQRMNLADMAHAPRWTFYLATVYPQQPCAPNPAQDVASTLLPITATVLVVTHN
jgi:hypothetical protein